MKIKIATAEELKKIINDNQGARVELFDGDEEKRTGYCNQSYSHSQYFVLRRKGSRKGKMYPYYKFTNDNFTPSYSEIKIHKS